VKEVTLKTLEHIHVEKVIMFLGGITGIQAFNP